MSQMRTWDIVVVGGGPAGSVTALELAKGGCRVALYDHSHPRFKPCSGFLTSSLDDLHPAVRSFGQRKVFHGPRHYTSPSGRTFSVPPQSAATKFDLASRETLDLHLLHAATDAGAEWKREKVQALKRLKNGWEIQTTSGATTARLVVGADGARSLVRKNTVGPIASLDMTIGVGRRYDGVLLEQLHTFFLKEGGVGFALPGNGFAQVVLGVRLAGARMLGNKLRTFISRLDTSWPTSYVSWVGLQPSPISREFFDVACAGDDFCLVGDAAGHCDAANGEGVYFAVKGAMEAAAAILEENPLQYETRWRDSYGERLAASSAKARRIPPKILLDSAVWAMSRSPSLVDAASGYVSTESQHAGSIAKVAARLPNIFLELVKG